MKLVIEIPKACAAALAVAVSNHAHGFSTSIINQKYDGSGNLRELDAEEKSTMRAWSRNRDALLSVKDQIKRQAGIK